MCKVNFVLLNLWCLVYFLSSIIRFLNSSFSFSRSHKGGKVSKILNVFVIRSNYCFFNIESWCILCLFIIIFIVTTGSLNGCHLMGFDTNWWLVIYHPEVSVKIDLRKAADSSWESFSSHLNLWEKESLPLVGCHWMTELRFLVCLDCSEKSVKNLTWWSRLELSIFCCFMNTQTTSFHAKGKCHF